MSQTVKQKTISGVMWNFTEKLSIRMGQFVISIILARLLLPADFGLIAIIMFFLNVSQILVESGFSKALIQKTERTVIDYVSVFSFNLLLSIILYLILFFFAPLIASFYSEPLLSSLIRVLSLTIVINALVIVQNVKLQVAVDFKKLAKINIVSVLISGALGIASALLGWGVWALVIQSLTRSFVSYLLFTYYVRWKTVFHFSLKNLKELWQFASHLLAAGFIAEVTNNIYNLLIGKYFSVASLGHYHRANNFTALSSDTVSQAIQQVTFPVLSQMQHDKKALVASYIEMMKMSAFIIFPVMAMLSAMAEPLVRILLNDAWLPVIPLLQWMAFTRILYPLNALNLNLLNAIGRSDLFFKVDVSKLPITIIALIITLPMGVKAMIIGQVVCAPIYYYINAIMPGRLFGFHFIKQVMMLLPILLATACLYVVSFFSVQYFESNYLQIIIGGALSAVVYLLVCRLLRVNEINRIVEVLSQIKAKGSNY